MKKTIMFICIFCVFFTCSCTNKENALSTDIVDNDEFFDNYSNSIVDYYNVDEVSSDEKGEVIINNTNDNKESNKQKNNQVTNSNKDNSFVNKTESDSSQVTENNNVEENKDNVDDSVNNEETAIETPSISNDNSVDENNMDYPIHKGRVDCYDADSCVNISIPIQVKFKKSISNAFYVEVIAKNDTTLGYFIQYIFVDYNYGSYDKCSSVGDDIKQTLSSKVIGYDCSSDGVLKVKTNY